MLKWQYKNPHHIGVTDTATRSNMKTLGEYIGTSDILSKLLNLWSAPDVGTECLSGNMLEYHYFFALLREVIESKIDKPKEKLTRFIKHTAGDAREVIKHSN